LTIQLGIDGYRRIELVSFDRRTVSETSVENYERKEEEEEEQDAAVLELPFGSS